MQDFLTVFKKNDGAKPIAQNFIRVPDFNDKTHELEAHSFVLYGDASEVDLSNAGDMLPCIRFNSKTKFPSTDKMPDGFNPQQVLENGKAPGLNIADLHTMGITGKGITVAIIDQPLNTEHIEIKDNIVHYESAGYPEHIEAQFHGTAVSSLLAGKTVGVAPDAKIVYFAANNTKKTRTLANKEFQKILRQHFPKNINFEETIKDILDGRHQTDAEFRYKINQIIETLPPDIKEQALSVKTEIDFTHRANALRKILFMNARLPQDKKISAVSISWGMLGTDPESTKLIKKLIESGVMVLTTDSHRFYGNKAAFTTIDRNMNSDPNDIKSYEAGFWKANKDKWHERLLVPAGGRTIAGYLDYDDYIYCGANGGMSWSTPYLVGVYALAKQIAPNLTPHRFFEIAQQTAVSNGKTGNNKIVQPQRIIQHLQNEMFLQQQNTPDR
ncbi:MAG: hypothetical protein J6J82_03870 [Alphaproteobacteria bacterium]|nr:hypothetical protein [Alphaproteobacteria bacterium]